jgi:hypothetical protein
LVVSNKDPNSDDVDLEFWCQALSSDCVGWRECLDDHGALPSDAMDGERALSHGVWHQKFHFGWATSTDMCSLLAFSDFAVNDAADLAETLGEGRHPIEFDWFDEHTIQLYSATVPR